MDEMSEPTWPSWLARPPSVDELPTDDGEPLESQRHRLQTNLLLECLEVAWARRSDFYAGGNQFYYYSALQAKRNDFRGPDVFVVLETEHRPRQAWVVWEEDGKHPDVIIELTSPSTATIDRVDKKRLYRLLRIPEYFVFDPDDGTLEGLALDASHSEYVPIEPSAAGRLHSARLGLDLGRWDGHYQRCGDFWLRWFGQDGVVLPTEAECTAEERLRVADAQHARTQAERARAEAEHARTEAEREVRMAQSKLAEYERRFGKLD